MQRVFQGVFRRPLSRSLITKEEKWQYNDEDIAKIVKHMQEIVLLKGTQQSVMEQVWYMLDIHFVFNIEY